MPDLSLQDIESLHAVKQLIDKDLSQRHTVAKLAIIARMSCTKFKAGFKISFGCNVFEYAQMQRMKLAYKLVVENYQPIKTIARLCGFQHSSHFNAAFKKAFGITAKKLRSEL